MRKNALGMCAALLGLAATAHAGWIRIYGSSAACGEWVEQTSDGGYIVTGETDSVLLDKSTIYLIKTDSLGDTLWTRECLVGHLGAWGKCVQQTSDGGYIVGGSTEAGPFEACLIKTDAQGNVEWTQIYDIEGGLINCVRQLPDGGYIAAGRMDSLYPGQERSSPEVWILRTDSEGNLIHSSSYGDSAAWDFARSLQLTPDGGCIVTGRKTGGYLWLLKTDWDGEATSSQEWLTSTYSARATCGF